MRLELHDRRPAFAAAAVAALGAAIWLGWPTQPSGSLTPPPLLPNAAPSAPALPAPVPAAQPEASPDGLVLHGLTGSGAIIAFPDGTQRVVRTGRQVLPGLTLQEIRQHHAILHSSTGTFQIGFDGTRAAPAPAPPASTGGDAARASTGRQETLKYRLGLAPRREGARITGFTIRPEADLPMLRRAGLRAGDTILSVNGQAFTSEERVMELADEIAASFNAEFEFERSGQRMSASIIMNPR